jgi:hypothetical protein
MDAGMGLLTLALLILFVLWVAAKLRQRSLQKAVRDAQQQSLKVAKH